MTYQELLENARTVMAPNCRVCPDCNGIACKGQLPGVGAYGNGRSFTVCREYLQSVKINMNTLYTAKDPDLSVRILDKALTFPLMAAPLGGMAFNYNGYMKDLEFNEMMLKACREEGIICFSGDTPDENFFISLLPLLAGSEGRMISTVKPWELPYALQKALTLRETGAQYMAMDVDSAGLPALEKHGHKGVPKSEEDLRTLMEKSGLKLIVKGVMTSEGALTAKRAGAAAVIVSSHGGRHFEDAPATAEVLPEIRAAVGPEYPVFIDGGIRTGADIFKVLALGADAAMIGRPFAIAAHGGREEGLSLYIQKLRKELAYIMLLTGCRTISDITTDKIRIPS